MLTYPAHPIDDTPGRPAFRISSLADVLDTAGLFGPTVIVTVMRDDPEEVACLAEAWNARVLHIRVSDKTGRSSVPEMTFAVSELLSLAQSLTADDRILIHCQAGISRSPAAALILDITWSLTAGIPAQSAISAGFDRLSQWRPHSAPNSLMVNLADNALGLRGAMRKARIDWRDQQSPS